MVLSRPPRPLPPASFGEATAAPQKHPAKATDAKPTFAELAAAAAKPKKAGGGTKPAKAKAEPRQMTPEEQAVFDAREENRAWRENQTAMGKVIGVFSCFATRKQQETAAAEGKKPSPSSKDVRRKVDSVKEALGCVVRVTKREDADKVWKVVYAAWSMTEEDRTRFAVTPIKVTEKKQHPAQTWTSVIR